VQQRRRGLSALAGRAAAWPREETREWTKGVQDHSHFRDLDGWATGNASLKKMRVMPDTLMPAVYHMSDAIVVVRRPFKVGPMGTYRQGRAQMTALSYMAPAWELIVLSPPYFGQAWDYLPRLHRERVRS